MDATFINFNERVNGQLICRVVINFFDKQFNYCNNNYVYQLEFQ